MSPVVSAITSVNSPPRPPSSFAEIAEHEAQGERHIRLLAPLALLSPRIIAAIVDGTAPADLTVTGLAKALPYSWAEQEQAATTRRAQSLVSRSWCRSGSQAIPPSAKRCRALSRASPRGL